MDFKNPKTLALLGLDLSGSILFVIGAMGQFGGSGSLLPEGLQFPGHNFALITLGIAMIVPYMVHVVAQARQSKDSGK